LINLVATTLGGVGAGKSSPTFNLGTVENMVSGLVGGGILGSIGGVISQAVAPEARAALSSPQSLAR
jgi:hypothetical protein